MIPTSTTRRDRIAENIGLLIIAAMLYGTCAVIWIEWWAAR